MTGGMGSAEVRGENISKAIKGYGDKLFKIKQVCLLASSDKWEETYYRETANPLDVVTNTGGFSIQGVARGASPPTVKPTWTIQHGFHQKFMSEGLVFLEDALTNAIDVQQRTIFKISESITDKVELYLYGIMTAAAGHSVNAAGTGWDAAVESTRKPISDILKGIQQMTEDHYDVKSNGFLLLTPHDYRALMENSKVVNNVSFKTADIVSNGRMGQVCSLTIIESNSVTDNEAMIIMGQRAATYKTAVPITSGVKEDIGINKLIRSWEIGVCFVTDPNAIYVIDSTQE